MYQEAGAMEQCPITPKIGTISRTLIRQNFSGPPLVAGAVMELGVEPKLWPEQPARPSHRPVNCSMSRPL